MTADEDLEQIFGGGGTERLHAEVLEDEEIDTREPLHQVMTGPRGIGVGEVDDEIEGAAHERTVPRLDRADGKGDRAVRPPDPRRPDQQHAAVRLHEASARERGQFRLGQFQAFFRPGGAVFS